MMKKLLLLVMLLPVFQMVKAQEEIVKWTFPTGQLTDTVQNGTNALNLTRTIRIEGAGPITMTNGQTSGDYAATATNWIDGMDVKNWNIKFKTTGYDQVKISSKQRAGGNNGGPADFKLQFKIGSTGVWADVPGGTVTLANDWFTGVITNLDLPAECQNQSNSVYIRWIMTSNADVLGGNVSANGVSKIDDIIITGMPLTGIDEVEAQKLNSFPNPSFSDFSVSTPAGTTTVEIFNNCGQLVYSTLPEKETISIEKPLPAGMYFIKAIAKDKTQLIKHIIK
jgi:hypothetical protein